MERTFLVVSDHRRRLVRPFVFAVQVALLGPTRAGRAALRRSRMAYRPPPNAAIAVAPNGLRAHPEGGTGALSRG